MKQFLIGLLMVWPLCGMGLAADRTPAGYVVEVKLAGDDSKAKTTVVRDGGEMPAKLMMPLFDKDVVFLRDPESRIALELGDGKNVALGGALIRYQVEGEIDTGDSTWGIISSIGGLFAGEDEPAPENMVSRGGTLMMPMAARRSNMLLPGHSKLWLGWSGGKAPFAVSLVKDGGEQALVQNVDAQEAEVLLPAGLPEKFALAVRDAEQQKVQVRFRLAPTLPADVKAGAKTIAETLAQAALLTADRDGTWSIEAAQVLHANGTAPALALLEKVRTGWKYDPPAP